MPCCDAFLCVSLNRGDEKDVCADLTLESRCNTHLNQRPTGNLARVSLFLGRLRLSQRPEMERKKERWEENTFSDSEGNIHDFPRYTAVCGHSSPSLLNYVRARLRLCRSKPLVAVNSLC